jgi:cysteine desulfurase/selenocysteine lyase
MTMTVRATGATAVLDTLDVAAIKADFPILNQVEPGREPLAFLDSAASSQKPRAVIDALSDYYATSNANIHRGVYRLSERATARYEEARHLVADFIGATDPDSCIFVRNTTEAINLVAQSWGRTNLRAGDAIVVTEMEHHSNLVPWHLIAEQTGARIAAVPLLPDQTLDLDAYGRLLEQGPKLVAVSHVSNGLGVINDVVRISAEAHRSGAVVLVDAAQSAPHLPIDVAAIGCDFLALSGHKMLGPMGSGVLYGRRELLDAMPPFMGGGGMIRKVSATSSTYADVPARFEAGTPAVGDAVGLGVAVEYLNGIGLGRIQAHEKALLGYAMERLDDVPGLVQLGPRDLAQRSGVVSFTLDGVHPHDVAAILDEGNVAVRAGHHCNQPLMDSLGLTATTRASFYLYNDESDVDRLVAGLHRVREIFG